MKFEVGGDECGGEFGVGGGTGSSAPDGWGDVMKLFAVLGIVLADVSMLVMDQSTLSATMGPLVALVSAAI